MPEKREALEHAEGADRQDPCDMAKARWVESQSPEVQPHTHCDSVSEQCCQDTVVHRSQPETSTRQSMGNDPIQGDEWDAYVALDTFNTDGTRDRLRDASPMATEFP